MREPEKADVEDQTSEKKAGFSSFLERQAKAETRKKDKREGMLREEERRKMEDVKFTAKEIVKGEMAKNAKALVDTQELKRVETKEKIRREGLKKTLLATGPALNRGETEAQRRGRERREKEERDRQAKS